MMPVLVPDNRPFMSDTATERSEAMPIAIWIGTDSPGTKPAGHGDLVTSNRAAAV
jgi:hypothetical protein